MTPCRKTTRVVTAIDGSEAALAAVELWGRLGFTGPVEQTLVNVVAPIALAGSDCLPCRAELLDRAIAEREQLGRKALEEARARAAKYDEQTTSTLQRNGDPTDVLLHVIDERRADVVAVGSAEGSFWDHVVSGSVHRNLLHMAPCSILFARPEPLPSRRLRAVLATDHSEYARLATRLLLRLLPRGFENVTIVTAYPESLPGLVSQGLGTDETDDLSRWLEDRLHAANAETAKELAPLGSTFALFVSSQPPVLAIREALEEHDADVLIVGARGRRFFERLTVGSVSQQLVQHATRHVLLLRPEHFTGSKVLHHGDS